MYRRVFISHASEDLESAESLYQFLESKGYQPWLDKKKLRIGSDWDNEIRRALGLSDFVVLLLSSISVKKRGYVQREFKISLEHAETKLSEDIYLLPILLDDCEIPRHLAKYHWLKIQQGDCFDQIVDSIEHQREIYLKERGREKIEITDIREISISLNLKKEIEISYSCSLPFFPENDSIDSRFINSFIQQAGYKIISEVRKTVEDEDYMQFTPEGGFDLELSYSIVNFTDKFLSLIIVSHSYLGGAHPNSDFVYINISFNPEKILELRDVLCFEKSERETLIDLIDEFSFDEGQRDALLWCMEDEFYAVGFTLSKVEICVYFNLPRVVQCYSDLRIPIDRVNIDRRYLT